MYLSQVKNSLAAAVSHLIICNVVVGQLVLDALVYLCDQDRRLGRCARGHMVYVHREEAVLAFPGASV